jgi:hypothetical protein
MAGVVVIFENRGDDTAPARLAYWFLSAFKPLRQATNRTLEWVKAQQLPFVIAATGYSPARFSEDWFRRRFGLAPRIPIVPGPSLVDGSLLSMDRRDTNAQVGRSILSSIVVGRKMSFDSEYAKQVLGALCKVIETS